MTPSWPFLPVLVFSKQAWCSHFLQFNMVSEHCDETLAAISSAPVLLQPRLLPSELPVFPRLPAVIDHYLQSLYIRPILVLSQSSYENPSKIIYHETEISESTAYNRDKFPIVATSFWKGEDSLVRSQLINSIFFINRDGLFY